MSHDQPLDFQCPECWLLPGQPCIVISSRADDEPRPMRGFHRERLVTVQWYQSGSEFLRSMAWLRTREGIADSAARLEAGQHGGPPPD